MTQVQRLNLKWTVEDIDRLARFALSGLSVEKICSILEGTRLESTPEEIERLLPDIRRSYSRVGGQRA